MLLANRLATGISGLGIAIAPEVQLQLIDYLGLLEKWNKVYNLTAIRDPKKMIDNHLLDCLAVVPHLWPQKWLDVGSGGGLPGLVLAIVRPEWSFTLLDSNSKKTSFVQQASIELGLKNVSVICGRVEKIQAEQKFDGIISRAFAEVSDFVTLSRHLLGASGGWAAMKGAPEEELKNIPQGIRIEQVIPLSIPGVEASRCLVLLREDK